MSWLKDSILLTLIFGILFGAMLGSYPLHSPDSARYAEIPREMIETGDYVTPHLDYIKYFEKPPLFYWMQAGTMKVFGINQLAANLTNAVMALLGCLLVYFGARKLFDRLTGILSSLILATSFLYFSMERIITLDMTLTILISACLLCFLLANQTPPASQSKKKNFLRAMYIFAALAVMTKGLVGVVLPGLIIITWIAIFKDWRSLKQYLLPSGIVLFLLIALPWHLLVQIRNPEFFRFYFIGEHFLRYLTPYAERGQSWWFFPVLLIVGFLPWTAFLPQTVQSNLPFKWNNAGESRQKTTIFFAIWIVIIFAFYSFSNSKLPPYILPIFPPLAMLTGNYFATNWSQTRSRSNTISFWLIAITYFGLGVGTLIARNFFEPATHAISSSALIKVGISLIFSGLITILIYYRRGFAQAIITLIFTTGIFLISVTPIIPIANNQSIKPLITVLQTLLTPQDEVISYASYNQDLPFYLQRRITIVDYQGELKFGMEHQNVQQWVIGEHMFWERWNSNQRKFVITNAKNFNYLQKQAPTKMFVITKYLNSILATNQPLK